MSWFRRSPSPPADDEALIELAIVPLWLSEILRSALKEEGIEARINPSFDVVLEGLTNARVWVRRRDQDKAQQVLASLQNRSD